MQKVDCYLGEGRCWSSKTSAAANVAAPNSNSLLCTFSKIS